MHQDQLTAAEIAIKTHTTLETIPEDVASIIASNIQSWAEIEGDLDQRDEARR